MRYQTPFSPPPRSYSFGLTPTDKYMIVWVSPRPQSAVLPSLLIIPLFLDTQGQKVLNGSGPQSCDQKITKKYALDIETPNRNTQPGKIRSRRHSGSENLIAAMTSLNSFFSPEARLFVQSMLPPYSRAAAIPHRIPESFSTAYVALVLPVWESARTLPSDLFRPNPIYSI